MHVQFQIIEHGIAIVLFDFTNILSYHGTLLRVKEAAIDNLHNKIGLNFGFGYLYP